MLPAAVLIAGIWFLNKPAGDLPAMGPLLSPFTGFWNNADVEFAISHRAKRFALDGLESGVQVAMDKRQVPHIFADNLSDAVKAQGFMTAQARLWQMDFQTRATAGRLSEILGPDLDEAGDEMILRFDRRNRRLGLAWAAEKSLEYIQEDQEIYPLLLSYTDGVNQWINQLKAADYPIEYKLLGYEPELWTPFKTVLLLKSMGQMLTSREFDWEYTVLRAKLGEEEFEKLYPDFGGNLDPIIPTGTPWEFEPVQVDSPELSELEANAIPSTVQELLLPWEFDKRTRQQFGSNNWAVHGSQTKSGAPILSNDPHLPLNLPSIWFEVHLHTPAQSVYGVSLPGAPGVVIGFNPDIAWGLTNAGRDVRDWYHLDRRGDQYLYEGEMRSLSSRVERIGRKDMEDFLDTVYYSHHGPIVYDQSMDHEALMDCALRWELHSPSNEIRSLYVLNQATSFEDYREALKSFSCPGQNVVFASKTGDIAITQQGRFPARWMGQGRFILDGSRASHEWQAYIPAEQNAHIRNPQRGFVSSANQYPADSSYPYYQLGEYEYYRNRRINDLIEAKLQQGPADVEDMKSWQLDNYSVLAQDLLPDLLNWVPDARELLGSWDYMYNAQSTEASIFEAWYDSLYVLLWDEWQAGDFLDGELIEPDDWATVVYLKSADERWIDYRATSDIEDRSALAAMAWERAQTYRDQVWYQTKGTSFKHILSSLDAFAVNDVECGGNAHILNASSDRWGPSWRMIVEMSDPPKAYGIYPGGQEGNPGDAAYSEFIGDWAGGNYYELELIEPEELDARSNEFMMITLNPK